MNEQVGNIVAQVDDLLALGYTRGEAIKVINLSLKLNERGIAKPYATINYEGDKIYRKIYDSFDWEADKSEWKEKTTTEVMNELGIKAHYSVVGKRLSAMGLRSVCKRVDGETKKIKLCPPYVEGVF